jgi:hypothetical protein
MRIARYGIAIGLWILTTTSFALSPNATEDCEQHHCMAIIDAGSSGSRIHWYRYDLDANATPIHIVDLYSKKIKPGLSTIEAESTTISKYMDQLMSDFSKPNVPIYLYATAGMRLLSPETQSHYYAEIQRWFLQHPAWTLQDARTISGSEEGVFGWLSLNYHLHNLHDTTRSLAGLLEVGGASAQIAFPIQNTADLDPNDWVDLQVYGRHIYLYVHSFLGLGINELFNHAQDHSACFPQDYPLKQGLLAWGNAAQCQDEIGAVLQRDYQVDTITHAGLQHSIASDWYTVSAVSTMLTQTPAMLPHQAFTGADLLQQADEHYCQQHYQNLQAHYSDNEYIQKYCLLASYFSSLLVYGLNFSPDQTIHYAPDYDGSWTLGVLLQKGTASV